MRYGSSAKFAELQDYMLNFSNIYGIMPSQEAVMALCRCHALHVLVFGKPSDSETDALRLYQIVPHRSVPVDGILSFGYEERTLKSIRNGRQPDSSYMSPLIEKLRSMQLDKKSLGRLLALSDRQLQMFVEKLATEYGLDLSHFQIKDGDIQSLRRAIQNASDEDLLELGRQLKDRR